MISIPPMPLRTPGSVDLRATPRSRTALLALFFVPVLLWTNTRGADEIDLFRPPENKGYFVRASGKALFNVGVSVETVRPVYGPGEYGNGYVLPDIGGSPDLTWNWGYDTPDQVNEAQDQLTYERYENLPPLSTPEKSAIAPGGELMAGLEMGTFRLGKQTVHFGIEAGYGYNYLSVSTGSSGSGVVTYTMATYGLNGVPPAAPYAGTAEGPGPLIGLTPVSTNSVSSMSQAASSGELNSNLHNFKLGFWFDYPINSSFFTSLSVGYASIYADAQFNFTETLTPDTQSFPGYTTTQTVGGRDTWKPGVYVQWRMDYQISHKVDLFLGLGYQWNDKMTFSGADRNVTLDFSAMFGASAGVQVNF